MHSFQSRLSIRMDLEPTMRFRGREVIPVRSLLCLDPAISDYAIFTGGNDGRVSEWDMRSMKKKDIFHIGKPHCMCLKALDNTLFTQDVFGDIKLWEPSKSAWKQKGAIDIDHLGFAKIDVTNSFGGLVACPTRFSAVSIYSVKDCNRVMGLHRTPHSIQLRGYVMAIKFVELGQNCFLLLAYQSGDLVLYDLKTKDPVSNVKFADCILSLDFDTGSMQGIIGGVGNIIHTFTINKSRVLGINGHLDIICLGARIVKIIPHKGIVVIGGSDGLVRINSWKDLKPITSLMDLYTGICDIDFLINIMVVADSCGKLCFWDF